MHVTYSQAVDAVVDCHSLELAPKESQMKESIGERREDLECVCQRRRRGGSQVPAGWSSRGKETVRVVFVQADQL